MVQVKSALALSYTHYWGVLYISLQFKFHGSLCYKTASFGRTMPKSISLSFHCTHMLTLCTWNWREARKRQLVYIYWLPAPSDLLRRKAAKVCFQKSIVNQYEVILSPPPHPPTYFSIATTQLMIRTQIENSFSLVSLIGSLSLLSPKTDWMYHFTFFRKIEDSQFYSTK